MNHRIIVNLVLKSSNLYYNHFVEIVNSLEADGISVDAVILSVSHFDVQKNHKLLVMNERISTAHFFRQLKQTLFMINNEELEYHSPYDLVLTMSEYDLVKYKKMLSAKKLKEIIKNLSAGEIGFLERQNNEIPLSMEFHELFITTPGTFRLLANSGKIAKQVHRVADLFEFIFLRLGLKRVTL